MHPAERFFGSLLIISGMAAWALTTPNSAAQTLTYNFNDGSMQGWTNMRVSTAAAGYYNLAFGAAQQAGAQYIGLSSRDQNFIPYWSTTGTGVDIPPTGPYFLGEIPMTNYSVTTDWDAWPAAGSGAHQTLWVQSPPFRINNSGALTFLGVGSSASIPLTSATNIPEMAGTWDDTDPAKGSCAVGLLRDDGVFVLSKDFTDGRDTWATYSFTASQLAPFVNDGHTYTLNMVDFWSGRNAWCAIDDVSIPGTSTKLNQTITGFGSLADKPIGSFNILTECPAIAASSDLPVSFTVSGPATISGSIVTITNWGIVTVTASQPGNATYNPAPPVSQSFTVLAEGKASQTITFDAPADHSYGETFTLDASASSGLPVSFTLTGPATLNGNEVTCTGGGIVTVTATQNGSVNYLSAPPVTHSFISKHFITYDFNDGTKQGWVTKSSSTTNAGYAYNLAFGAVTNAQLWNTTTYNPGLGDYFLGETPSANDSRSMTWANWPVPSSGVHQTLWIQSPPFVLNGCGDLTYLGTGCDGAIDPATGRRDITLLNRTVPAVAGTWGAESGNAGKPIGIIAVGLRRDDGVFVLSHHFQQNGMTWDPFTFTAAELAPFVNDGHTYTLDLVDALAGTYAWCAIDNVSIPGELPRPTLDIALGVGKTNLVLTWTPTTDGQSSNAVSTVLSSVNPAAPANTWTEVASLRTQNGSTSVQLPIPATQTYYRVKVMAPGAPVSPTNVFQNPGVYSQTVNGKLYEWIPSQDVNFQIQPGGEVKIIAPLTKRSFDSGRNCNRFIYDHTHTRLAPSDEAALFGSGLLLPPGNHGFAILWLNATTYDEVYANSWTLMDRTETWAANSAQVDYFSISIVPIAPTNNNSGSIREIVLPYDLQRVSWLPHYQVLPYDLHLPKDKGFGITRMLWDIPLDEVYKKVTHIQYMYGELDAVPARKKWTTKRALNNQGVIASDEWLIANTPIDRDFTLFAQLEEDYGAPVQDHAQLIFKGIYQRFTNELGVTSPNQTRIYDDYFSHLSGYDNSGHFSFSMNVNNLIAGLSSMAAARGQCTYFTQGAYLYRNWFQGGYLDSWPRIPEGIRIYNEIYNFEKKFCAIPDRKVAKFGWGNSEGVNSAMYRPGTRSRLHFANGDIIRSVEVTWPFHMMLNESFWTLLLGHDYVLWHSSVRLVSDINAWGDSWAAGAGTTKWQPTGGSIVDYNASNPSHPQRVSNPKGIFPPNPHSGESGAFAGAWLVSQITEISDRTSKTVEYCPFSYKINGGPTQTGYYNSNNPQNGSLGNAKLSRYGVANYGQANIVKTFEARKPICIYTEGVNGGALIYHNVYCGLTDVNEVTISTKLGNRTFTVTGNSLHVFYVTSAPQ